MTYKVLARKWRPRLFSELVGQQHVVRALHNSIDNQKLHHAYLFTGTRGVGKTTIARVFAKSLNCEKGPSSTPCLTCSTCISIEEGHYADFIEVDAASRTRVEDTKELLDNVQYLPSQGHYKIYLIDEVHMLSGHSFNALLKTLEEPPAHVIFLLATTDPQKIPVTVLSRCLQFTLKPLMINEILGYLETVSKGENITFELPALELLAKAAKGSLRDSLSLFDQAIAYSGSNISFKMLLEMLGTVGDELIYDLFRAISSDNGEQIFDICQAMVADGVNFSEVLERFIDILHQIAIRQSLSCSKKEGPITQLGALFSKEDIQLFYEICLKGLKDMGVVPLASIGFEMTVLRMLSFKLSKPVELGVIKQGVESHVKTKDLVNATKVDVQNNPNPLTLETTNNNPVISTLPPVLRKDSPPNVTKNEMQNRNSLSDEAPWPQVVEQLSLGGMAKTVIMHCNLIEKTTARVTLGLEANYQAMLTSTARVNIEAALKKYWQSDFKVVFDVLKDNLNETPAAQKNRANEAGLETAKASLSTDPCFNEIIDSFDGKVDDSSLHLVKGC